MTKFNNNLQLTKKWMTKIINFTHVRTKTFTYHKNFKKSHRSRQQQMILNFKKQVLSIMTQPQIRALIWAGSALYFNQKTSRISKIKSDYAQIPSCNPKTVSKHHHHLSHCHQLKRVVILKTNKKSITTIHLQNIQYKNSVTSSTRLNSSANTKRC